MKTKNLHVVRGTILLMSFLLTLSLHAQISFQGLISEGDGGAGWDADGTGPEPQATGHGIYVYYVASRDYVDPNCNYGSHVTGIGDDFPAFSQALADHGFVPEQVKNRMGLASLGDDQEGSDWFVFGSENYMNFYPVEIMIYLDNEPMISGSANYIIFYQKHSGQPFFCTSNYFLPADASESSSPAVQEVAAAFLQDVGTGEIRMLMNTFGTMEDFGGNGRYGSYFNFEGTFEKGIPALPFQGLAVNHEGFAGRDADGTGPEPKRKGHSLSPTANQRYYIASVDYDDIDPDPAACFARLLDEGINGFGNFKLQLAHRGLSLEQVTFKMGLRGLDEDIMGEDWWIDGTIHHTTFYQSVIRFEINGEPLFGYVCDTNRAWFDLANPYGGWKAHTASSIIYDASSNSSDDVKMVAMSFFKDLESRHFHAECDYLNYTGEAFSGNGRTGIFLEIIDANMIATPPRGTAIPTGDVSGQWTTDGNPYIVTGDITIPDGQTLQIDPGVVVKCTDQIKFKVQGTIIAEGDSSNTGSIVFTSANPDLGWGHIEFDGNSGTNDTSIFKHCIFEWGHAPEASPGSGVSNCGGAIGIRDYNNIHLENCLFRNNRALFDGVYPACGGAIGLWTSSPVIRNCVFSNNSATWAGAIACFLGSSPEIVNCLFYGNKSLRDILDGGGAIVVGSNSNPILLNNTFVNNHSNFRGGALEIWDGSNPDLINNIFRGNTAPENSQIYISSNNCNVDIQYNDIEGGQEGIGPFGIGTGVYENNLDADPFFADALALNYQLSDSSLCKDSGTPDVTGLNLPPYDLLGNNRIEYGRIDMGPYEFPFIVYPGINNPVASGNVAGIAIYPNPFLSEIVFHYELKTEAPVSLAVFNHLGQAVSVLVDDRQAAGAYTTSWNAKDLPAGMYVIRMQAGKGTSVQKILKIE